MLPDLRSLRTEIDVCYIYKAVCALCLVINISNVMEVCMFGWKKPQPLPEGCKDKSHLATLANHKDDKLV